MWYCQPLMHLFGRIYSGRPHPNYMTESTSLTCIKKKRRRRQHYDQKHGINTIEDDNITEPQKGGNRNLFADFVCQMLPTATKTCHYLNKQTNDDQFRQRVNKPIERGTISRQDMFRRSNNNEPLGEHRLRHKYLLGSLNGGFEIKTKRTILNIWYDV